MPGFLGYDPEGLDRLLAAMRPAATELAQLRDGDVDAAVAMARVRSAQAKLEGTWLPVVSGLRGCVAMTGFTPVHLDGSDARTSELFMLQGYGWQVLSDPAGASPETSVPVTASQARAIAALLSGAEAEQLLDTDEERSWLAGRLEQILGDPVLAADFRRNLDAPRTLAIMGDVRFAAACLRDDRATQQLDEVIGSSVAIVAAAPDGGRVRDVVSELDPYAAALVIRSLDVDGAALGALCAEVLRRWRNPDPRVGPWPDACTDELTADLLLPRLVDDPAAARSFLLHAVADDPGVLFASSNDRALVDGVLLAGTDPASTGASDAGRIIVPVLDWLEHDLPWHRDELAGGEYDPAPVLGSLVGPWLLYFGHRAPDWGWSHDEADDALAFVLDDGAAMDDLITCFERWRSIMREHPLVDADQRLDVRWLREISTLMDQMAGAFEREEVEDATRRRGWVTLVDWVIEQAAARALSRVPLGDQVPGPATEVIDRLLTRIGWLPPSVDAAAALAHGERSERLVTTAVVALVAIVDQLTTAGQLPPGTIDRLDLSDLAGRDPRATADRLLEFVESLHDECSPAAYNAMSGVLSEFLSAQVVNDLD